MSDPATQPFIDLLKEVVVAIEQNNAQTQKTLEGQIRHEAHEAQRFNDLQQDTQKRLDTLTKDIRRHTEQITLVVALWSTEQEAARIQEARWDKLIATVWASAPIQMLVAGIIVAILNIMGTAYVARNYVPSNPEISNAGGAP